MELDLAASTLIAEVRTDVVWQRVMVLTGAESQAFFLRDLVTSPPRLRRAAPVGNISGLRC